MTITYQNILATRQTSTASASSRTHVVTNNPAAGDLIVFVGARNDFASESANSDTLTYSESGKWTELYSYKIARNQTDATANNGCVCAVFVGRANSDFSGGTFTWSYGTAVARAVWGGIYFRSNNGGVLDVVLTQTGSGSATTTSITLTNSTGRTDLAYAYCSACEHTSAAPGSPFNNAGWLGTAGSGFSTADMTGACYYNIPGTSLNQTGSQTVDANSGGSSDWAGIIIAIGEFYGRPRELIRSRGAFINSNFH